MGETKMGDVWATLLTIVILCFVIWAGMYHWASASFGMFWE